MIGETQPGFSPSTLGKTSVTPLPPLISLASLLALSPPPPTAVGPSPASEPANNPATLGVDYEPPFASETLELSAVLEEAAATNLDLTLGDVDVKISEQSILAAVGAFDVFITAGLNGNISESPQRGSQVAFSLAQRQVGGNVGFNRRLETGGQISLAINFNRTLTDQPINFFDSSQGATTLSSYAIVPTLSITQPLLQGAGIKVNKAEINKAKLATTAAEAQNLITAQNLARDLIGAYWDVLFAHRDLINKRRSVEQAQRQLDRTNKLINAGRLAPTDAKAVEQAIAAREADVLNAENTLLDRSLTLRTSMGQEFADRPVLGVLPATDPIVRPRAINVQEEVTVALKANPQIRQIELNLASRRIDEMVAANRRLPQLDFSGNFTPQGRSIDSTPNPQSGDPGAQGSWGEAFRNIFSNDVAADGLLADWTLGGQLTLTWDVQNRTPKANHEIARLQMKRAEVQLKQVRQQVAAGVIRAANSLRTAASTITVAQISYDLATENLATEEARFNVGRSTAFDVLQRLDELDSAAADALNAQIGYLKALAALQAFNGEILPAYGLAE